MRVASIHSLASAPDIRDYDGANGGKAPINCLTAVDTRKSAKADLLASIILHIGADRPPKWRLRLLSNINYWPAALTEH
uniref:Uncharacterized protein n=1 Tax=Paraburkholderia sprentiae WSM5005 TaxID=754502 RepID=A0A1I9YUL4_9BURK